MVYAVNISEHLSELQTPLDCPALQELTPVSSNPKAKKKLTVSKVPPTEVLYGLSSDKEL